MIKAGPKTAPVTQLYQNADPVLWFEKITMTDMYDWQRAELPILCGDTRPRKALIQCR